MPSLFRPLQLPSTQAPRCTYSIIGASSFLRLHCSFHSLFSILGHGLEVTIPVSQHQNHVRQLSPSSKRLDRNASLSNPPIRNHPKPYNTSRIRFRPACGRHRGPFNLPVKPLATHFLAPQSSPRWCRRYIGTHARHSYSSRGISGPPRRLHHLLSYPGHARIWPRKEASRRRRPCLVDERGLESCRNAGSHVSH